MDLPELNASSDKNRTKIDPRFRSRVQEDFVSLYLRLNGFFVSPFIVHSPVAGNNYTELDALALRMPFSSEPEREIGPDPILELSTMYTDLVLCEVKSRGQSLRFNDAFAKRPDAIGTVLKWSGLFEPSEIRELSHELQSILLPNKQLRIEPATILGPRGTRIRAMLFCPERNSRHNNQPWFLTGTEMMQYIWKCLCPRNQRAKCSTAYDFQVWRNLEPIVRYFKSCCIEEPGNIKSLYSFVFTIGGQT